MSREEILESYLSVLWGWGGRDWSHYYYHYEYSYQVDVRDVVVSYRIPRFHSSPVDSHHILSYIHSYVVSRIIKTELMVLMHNNH